MSRRAAPCIIPEVQRDARSATGDRGRVEKIASEAGDRALVSWLTERATVDPDGIAFRYKRFGIWHDVTWRDGRQRVARIAAGLDRLGVGAGDVVAVMAGRMPEWFLVDLAVQSLGALTCGIQPTTSAEELAHITSDAGCSVFVAEDQEYIDKLLEVPGNEATVRHLVVVDEQGMFGYEDERLHSLDDLEALGEQWLTAEPGWYGQIVAERSPDDVIGLFYTSGTTGRSKGVMLSSRSLIVPNVAVVELLGRLSSRDRTCNFLPSAVHMERVYCIIYPLLYGAVAHIPESDEAVNEALVEVQPTVVMSSPRILESLASRISVDMQASGPVRRSAYRMALAARGRYLTKQWDRGRADPVSTLGAWVGDRLVTRPILRKLGLGSVRYTQIGGAAIAPQMKRRWQEWGLRPTEGYGMTETSGSVTIQTDRFPRPGDAGPVIPTFEMRIAPDGEVLFRGIGSFAGYWNNPVATAETLDDDGWIHSADIGTVADDGALRIIDRRRDLLHLEDGTVVPSATVELSMKMSPYVRDAAVMPLAANTTLGVLVEMEYDNVADWARSHRVPYTSFSNLAENAETRKLIAGAVETANEYLRAEGLPTIAGFRVLPKELDPEEGDEVTVTRKVKRAALAKKFGALVEDLDQELGQRAAAPSEEPAEAGHAMSISEIPDALVSSVVLASFYMPVAIAWVIVFRASGTLNFAVGEFALLGAFVVQRLLDGAGLPRGLAILIAILVVMAFGAGTYGALIRPLAGQPPLAAIMVTLGLAILITSALALLFGSENRVLDLGVSGSTGWRLPGNAYISPLDVVAILAGVGFSLLVVAILRWSKIGIQMRAAAELPLLASQSAVRIHLVIAAVWALSAVSGSIAGVIFAAGTTLSFDVIIIGLRGIAPAVLGGLDSVPGAIVGSFLVALIETIGVTYLGGEARDAVLYTVVLLVLMLRPYGLFGRPEVRRI